MLTGNQRLELSKFNNQNYETISAEHKTQTPLFFELHEELKTLPFIAVLGIMRVIGIILSFLFSPAKHPTLHSNIKTPSHETLFQIIPNHLPSS
jgi:hypothetical protein